MATLGRRPLATRASLYHPNISPVKQASKNGYAPAKRARSPEPPHDPSLSQTGTKRPKYSATSGTTASVTSTATLVNVVTPNTATSLLVPATSATVVGHLPPTAGRENKERRDQLRVEWKEKYCKAFPGFTFYIDIENIDASHGIMQELEKRIQQLGGHIEDFFSNEITHLISNQPPPAVPPEPVADKENKTKGGKGGASLKSPIKLRGREDVTTTNGAGMDLVSKATVFGSKIWSVAKLDNILSRCLEVPQLINASKAASHSTTTGTNQRSLQRLLQSERIHGTSERDPSQKRHDFRYFSKGSKFVLVEDLKQEWATIAAHEYIVPKGKDDQPGKAPWPILHCHPHTRGPFHAYDEKEKRRWERQQLYEREQAKKEEEAARLMNVKAMKVMKRQAAEATILATRQTDLRRTVSLSNIRRTSGIEEGGQEFDPDHPESVNASGYLQSGVAYVAASGNSVGITSTAGTTSAGYTSRQMAKLPLALAGRMRQEVVTSRKFRAAAEKAADGEPTKGVMGPPKSIPERQPGLRKSKSTNTLKLPKREEGSKPGYCESCRAKFDDFKTHVTGRRHRKFAEDSANFFQLDCVLARVQRRTKEEVWEERQKLMRRRKTYCGGVPTSQADRVSSDQEYDFGSDHPVYQDSEDGTEDVTHVASSGEISFEHISASTAYEADED